MKPPALLSLFLVFPALAQSPDLLPQRLDALIVTASPHDRSLFESVRPATVLEDREFMFKISPSLGETLAKEPGVSSSSFGPGASRPIIRGLGDDRLRVLQNGTSVLDVSNVSPDHAVATDPLSIRSVEIVRGPATLLYGPNTVGGVVNVIDDRIPEERINGINGALDARYGSADSLGSLAGAVNFGVGPFAFHLDAFTRETDDVKLPGDARSKRLRSEDPRPDESRGILRNSFTESDGAAAGGSYIWEKGFAGISYSGIDSFYGTVAEEDVMIDLRQRRWDLRGAVYEPIGPIEEINYKFGYTDYEHAELEGSEVGTRFTIDGFNARTEVLHGDIGGLEGAIGMEIQRNEFSAFGDEAFLPTVENQVSSLVLFEETELGSFTLQFGGRYDYQSNETGASVRFGPALHRDFNAFSTSAGLVYNPTEHYAAALSLGYSQRPPTYVELFADGPHVATDAFERGDPNLDTEDSFSLDLSVRKKAGRVTGSISGFYYRFHNFIANQASGQTDPTDDLPIFDYEAISASFCGAEVETTIHLLEAMEDSSKEPHPFAQRLDLIFLADYVRAEDRNTGRSLPRIPPFRTTVALDYQINKLGARIDAQWSARQNRTADDELPTDSYVLLNAGLDYTLATGAVTTTFFVKGVNLFNQDARLSTSYLKEIAPLAARGLIVGMRSEF